MSAYELSIIVPVLNEAKALPALLASLAGQRGVSFELIIVDGGSTDETVPLLQQRGAGFPLRLLGVPAGRARQLNAGAARAGGELLLFLHADSRFPEPDALCRALRSRKTTSAAPLAGRFRLRFRRHRAPYGFGYYFWECKARLDRPACVHGDQGLLVSRELFERTGPFDEQAPLAPETWFADLVRREVPWRLFPAVIETSARRFESEGLASRQILNALLMNFAAIGWDGFFARAQEIYRRQDQTAPLQLKSYTALIDALLAGLPPHERRRIWRETGRYVRSHAWQIPFALDARRGFVRGYSPDALPTPLLCFHDRWFDRITANRCGDGLAAFLTRTWYRWLRRRAGRGKI